MLHPALSQALATAYIEDKQRAAARWRAICLARRIVHEPRVPDTQSSDSDPHRFSHGDSAAR